MLNNILMGVQVVLSVLLLLVIMPQEGKGNFSSDFSGAGDDFETQAFIDNLFEKKSGVGLFHDRFIIEIKKSLFYNYNVQNFYIL